MGKYVPITTFYFRKPRFFKVKRSNMEKVEIRLLFSLLIIATYLHILLYNSNILLTFYQQYKYCTLFYGLGIVSTLIFIYKDV